ncbi:tRNA dihydrouridine(20/20a) synthase DusA [Inquilinus sp. CAU 1745]|uniref:tRNA dihydrouridine(20/20a) synthase DusA n=1 Tax=Inquilinus sp. CAU 1745 TaxID=3140369 RepID=UPI00325BF337
METVDRRFSIAPMMDWTDRHDRFFLRLLSTRALLYTEMVTSAAVIRGDRDRLLGFSPAEHPVALQLGGSDPDAMAEAARIGEAYGYDEININVGCPSDRVQSGRFGACLMAEPETVAACVRAMIRAVSAPVTVKCRIGIDDQDDYLDLARFVTLVSEAGTRSITVHARKAWLNGLSPKENRDIPPLQYDRVYRLKQEFPELEIAINGGVRSLDEAEAHLRHVDGVMMGREAYHNPYMLADVDRRLFGEETPPPDRFQVVDRLLPYIEAQRERGTPLNAVSRHILGLFQGMPGARAWRRHLAENAHLPGAGAEVVKDAATHVGEALARRPDREAA